MMNNSFVSENLSILSFAKICAIRYVCIYVCNYVAKQKQLGAVKRMLPSKVESMLQLNFTGKNKD